MPKIERESLGKGFETAQELDEQAAIKSEKVIQAQIRNYCNQRGFIVFASTFGKKTRRTPGEPDLIVLLPQRVLFVECKTSTGKLSPNQMLLSEKMLFLGHPCFVVRSLDEFMKIVSRLDSIDAKGEGK